MLKRGFAAALLFLAAATAWAAPGEISVVYLGAYDCFYCQHWEARAKLELLASPEGRTVRYFEVKGETLKKPITEKDYPAELKWLARRLGASRGVPRFLLLIDGEIARSVYGTNDYETVFLPALRRAVAGRRAGT